MESAEYDAAIAATDCMLLPYRLAVAARWAVHVPEMLVLYRVHDGGISQHNVERSIRDRARLWAVLEAHARARDDLGWATRRSFRQKKYAVACEVRPSDAREALALEHDADALDRAALRLRQDVHWFWSRLRVRLLGNPYPPPMAAEPLTGGQVQAIARLGCRLAG